MPQKGQIIHNPRTGEYVEFMETAAETNGSYSRIKIKVIPGGFKPVLHFHTTTDETFEVIGGQLTCVQNRETKTINAGEKITLPKNMIHTHYNGGKEDLVMYQTFTP
ncbi:MAG TPA: cupin domain-containing protein, partial [Chitinophagaceae bacterium]|nr:cupin domain-containing protein [Chitinophagaceae bacterium]